MRASVASQLAVEEDIGRSASLAVAYRSQRRQWQLFGVVNCRTPQPLIVLDTRSGRFKAAGFQKGDCKWQAY